MFWLKTHAVSKTARAASIAAATLSVLALSTAGASAQDLIVKYDQASIVRLSRPAVEIIVGNPSIADVSVQSGSSLVITGKAFGVTNIIAIDAQGQVIRDQRVMVRTDEERMVGLTKGGLRQSYSCTPICQPTLTIGDEDMYFKKVQDNMQSKSKISEGASDHGQGGGQ